MVLTPDGWAYWQWWGDGKLHLFGHSEPYIWPEGGEGDIDNPRTPPGQDEFQEVEGWFKRVWRQRQGILALVILGFLVYISYKGLSLYARLKGK